MSDENDSFDEVLVSDAEMIAYGKKIGASHLLICTDGPGAESEAVYVMPGECVDTKVERIQGGCPFVHVVDLEEDERNGALS